MTMTYIEAGTHILGGFRPGTEYNCSAFVSNIAGDGPSIRVSITLMDESEFNMLFFYTQSI